MKDQLPEEKMRADREALIRRIDAAQSMLEQRAYCARAELAELERRRWSDTLLDAELGNITAEAREQVRERMRALRTFLDEDLEILKRRLDDEHHRARALLIHAEHLEGRRAKYEALKEQLRSEGLSLRAESDLRLYAKALGACEVEEAAEFLAELKAEPEPEPELGRAGGDSAA